MNEEHYLCNCSTSFRHSVSQTGEPLSIFVCETMWYSMFTILRCEENMGLWDLQINGLCFVSSELGLQNKQKNVTAQMITAVRNRSVQYVLAALSCCRSQILADPAVL